MPTAPGQLLEQLPECRVLAVDDLAHRHPAHQEQAEQCDQDVAELAGGFGGARGPSEKIELPARDADVTVEVPTLPQQALLYRLCGDRNPLHSDPSFARAAGFDAPILHGLCTYGIVAKAATDAVLDGDASAVGSWSAKFAGIMLPGETLRVRIWRDGDRHLVTAESGERAAPVLADAVFTAR